LAKRRKPSTLATLRARPTKFDPESFTYFTLISFGVLLTRIVILFHKFIFSGKIFYGGDMMQAGIFFRSSYVNFVLAYGYAPQWNPYILGGPPCFAVKREYLIESSQKGGSKVG